MYASSHHKRKSKVDITNIQIKVTVIRGLVGKGKQNNSTTTIQFNDIRVSKTSNDKVYTMFVNVSWMAVCELTDPMEVHYFYTVHGPRPTVQPRWLISCIQIGKARVCSWRCHRQVITSSVRQLNSIVLRKYQYVLNIFHLIHGVFQTNR